MNELIVMIFFSVLYILTLYLFFKGLEYKESIKRLVEQVEDLKKANTNLSQIIQEEENWHSEKMSKSADDAGLYNNE